MNNSIWEQFGLKKNPYNILPLLEGGDLPITEAFVGRIRERKYIDNLLSSEDRACFSICGNVGVGKTSLANFEKVYWKYMNKDKPIFSFRREIEANEALLNKKNFLLEIIGSILRELELIDLKLIHNNDFLLKLNQMVDISQTFGLSGSISSGIPGIINLQTNIKEKEIIQPFHLTVTALEKNFHQLLEFILSNKIANSHYKGLIVHVNNFEIVMTSSRNKVIQFFAEIRDFLQTPNVYFIFLGPNNFFKDIITKENRVRSIFNQTPIILSPLSKEELVQAMNTRLKILKSETAKTIIKPFEDNVIFELYDMFEGDVRMVMSSLKDIAIQMADKLPKTLTVDEAMILLGRERLSNIENILTDEKMNVLSYIVNKNDFVTQNEIAQALQKAPNNLSNYYFKPLIEHDVIEVKKESGKQKFWGLTKKYLPLKRILQSQKNLTKQLTTLTKQLDLF